MKYMNGWLKSAAALVAFAFGFAAHADGLAGSGTKADPWVIDSLASLQYFAANTATYAGKAAYVKLTADIDLNGSASNKWTPITGWTGYFDGGNHKISNLYVDNTSSAAGFFSYLPYRDPNNQYGAEISNLIFENATVIGGAYVGVVSGGTQSSAANGQIKCFNVTVQGAISVTGTKIVGGIVGGGYPIIVGCKVIGNNGSRIECTGSYSVGGIVGFMAGYAQYPICSNTVQNVTVYGFVAGGITGTVNENNRVFDNAVSGCSITCTGDKTGVYTGYIGGWVANGGQKVYNNTVTDSTLESVYQSVATTRNQLVGKDNYDTALVGNGVVFDANGKVTAGTFEYIPADAVAEGFELVKVGDYYTVQEKSSAVARVISADGSTTNEYETLAAATTAAQSGDTITMLANSTEAENPVVAAGKAITIDLKGFVLDGMIEYYGDLTLTNSVGTGYIRKTDDWALYGTGNLVLAADVGASGARSVSGVYASNGATVTIATDIKIYTYTNGIRCDGANLTVTGEPTVDSMMDEAALSINGNSTALIAGGTYSGDSSLSGDCEGPNVTVTGGKFMSYVNDSVCFVGSGKDLTVAISGGIYSDASAEEYLAAGYEVVANTDPTTKDDYPYAVQKLPDFYQDATDPNLWHIRNVNGLKEFRDAVNNGTNFYGKTVRLEADCDLNNEDWTPIGKTADTPFGGKFTSLKPNGEKATISNLKIIRSWDDSSTRSSVGFFGVLRDENAKLENFKIHNAEIYGYLRVGVVLGGKQYCSAKVDGVEVDGLVKVTANEYAGVIAGRCYPSIYNCSVIGDEGSFVKVIDESAGDAMYAGGIVGWSGEGSTVITNCLSAGLTISCQSTETTRVGGITGIASYGNRILGCTVSNCVVTVGAEGQPDSGQSGLIVGANNGTAASPVILANAKVFNSTLTDNAIPQTRLIGARASYNDPAGNSVLIAHDGYDAYYHSLQDAVKSVGQGGTITLAATNSESFTMAPKAGVTAFTISAGGYALTGKVTTAEGYELKDNGDGTYSYGERMVAKIGEAKYETLAAAVAAVPDGGTIQMLVANVDEPFPAYEPAKAFTVKGLVDGYTGIAGTVQTAGTYGWGESGVVFENINWTESFCHRKMSDVTFRNCKFTGQYGVKNGYATDGAKWAFESCAFEQTDSYGLHFDEGLNTTVSLVNCSLRGKINGLTAGSANVVTFTACTIDGGIDFDGEKYTAEIKMRADTSFVGCTFTKKFADGLTDAKNKDDNGINIVNGYVYSFTSCAIQNSAASVETLVVRKNLGATSYAAIDAGTDSEGNYSSGMFVTKDAALIPLAADCELIALGNDVYQIGVMIDPGKGEKTVPAIEQTSDSVVNSNAVDKVVKDTEVAQKMKTETTVTGVKLTTEPPAEGLDSGMQVVVDKAKAENSEVREALDTTASMVTVKVDVVVTPTSYVAPTTEEAGTGTVAFDLTPLATVTVVTTNSSGVVESSVSQVVDVTNGMIDQNQKITVVLHTGFLPSIILHNDDNGKLIESFSGDQIAYKDGTCAVQISHFSQILAIQNASYVASVGSQMFSSVQDAFNYVTNGTVTLLKDVELTAGVTLAAGKKATFDLAGKKLKWAGNATAKSAGLIANAGELTLTGGTLDAGATTEVFATCTGDGETNTLYITDGIYHGKFQTPASTVTNAGPFAISGGYFDSIVPAAYCAIGYVPDEEQKVAHDNMYTVKDALVYIRNVKALQRYPWNGYVDITFEMCMNRDAPVTLFVAAYYQGQRVTALTEVTWVGGEQQTVNVADGTFKVAAKEPRTIHLAWNSNVEGAFPDMKADDITVKVIAK